MYEAGDRGDCQPPSQIAMAPLMGRDTELSLLKDRWEQAQEGMGQVVLVVGEPGLGKSRLVRTLSRYVESAVDRVAPVNPLASESLVQDSRVIEWRCSQHSQNSELRPVCDFLERFLEFGRASSPTARFDRLARHLDEYAVAHFLALFAKMLFLPLDESQQPPGLSPAREREETFRALGQWLDAYSRERPTLFIVEDLHWIDASSLEFLKKFIGESPHDRILTVLTFRPEFKTQWPVLAHHTTLALNRLTRRQVGEWMRRDTGGAVPDSLLAQIYQRTSGVPLLVEEFSRVARESSVFESVRDATSRYGRASTRELPETLQELVMARIDRMSIRCDVAQGAATLGREFDLKLLAAVLGLDEPILRVELAKLVAAGILYIRGEAPAESYLFKHVLLEEALRSATAKASRRRFHQQIAEVIEVRFRHLVETQPERLALHFAEAGLIEKAVRYFLKAGVRSHDRFAHLEAISHLNKGLELLENLKESPERDALELQFLGPLGTAYIASRGYAASEVGPVFRRARALCQRVGQSTQVFAMMWGNFAFHIVRGDFRVCAELAEEAVSFAARLNDPGMLMEALFLRGVTQLYRGDFVGARDSYSRAIAEFDDRQRTAFWSGLVGEDAGVTHRCYLSLALWHLGFADQALWINDEMIGLARSIKHPFSLEYALHHTAWLCQHCRLGTRAQAAADEQIQIATDQGFRFWRASGTLGCAGGLLLQGHLEDGLRLVQKGLESYRATGAELGIPYYLSMLAESWIEAGKFPEADAVLDEALSFVTKNDERFQEAELYRLRGNLILAESGNELTAEESFRQAIKIAQQQQSKAWELRATTSLAQLLQKRGRRADASQALSAALGLFTEGFSLPDVVDATALLERLDDERMRAEFAAGIKYVRNCIPPPMDDGSISVDWRYLPASDLGGDALGYNWIDIDHFALYLIDVTGHGLDAALLAVSVANAIRAGALSGADMRRPDEVLAKLNDAFQSEQHGERFFTIWYGVYHCASRRMTWSGGGHPPAVLLLPGGPKPLLFPSSGVMLGVMRGAAFPAQSRQIPAGTRLLVFSDGVYEIFREGQVAWNLEACIAHLATLGERNGNLMDDLLNHVYQLHGSPRLEDDFSIIEVRFR